MDETKPSDNTVPLAVPSSKRFICAPPHTLVWHKRTENPNVCDDSRTSSNGAPRLERDVVSGQMTKASTK